MCYSVQSSVALELQMDDDGEEGAFDVTAVKATVAKVTRHHARGLVDSQLPVFLSNTCFVLRLAADL